MKYFIKYQGLTLLWALFIFIICTIKLGGVGNSPMFFAGFDKLVHCGVFFVLTVLLCSGLLRVNRKHNLSFSQCLLSLLLPIVFGALIEILQAYVFTWRSGEWGDLFADSVGAAMALLGVLVSLWAARDAYK
jgi:VanZ family protein